MTSDPDVAAAAAGNTSASAASRTGTASTGAVRLSTDATVRPRAPDYVRASTTSTRKGPGVVDRAPVDRGFRVLLPLFPAAMRELGPIDADVVISSSSAWAHGVRVSERAFHVVYCHNPARWLYGEDYLGEHSAKSRLAKPLFAP